MRFCFLASAEVRPTVATCAARSSEAVFGCRPEGDEQGVPHYRFLPLDYLEPFGR